MAKRSSKAVAVGGPSDGPQSGPRRFGDKVVEVEAVYKVSAIRPRAPGPWRMEAEKVAWTDAETGLGCIIRRSSQFGHLAGYVAVGPDHPLHGWDAQAVNDLGVGVHGGLSYADECEDDQPEEISVCHPPRRRRTDGAGTARSGRPASEEDDLWWLGFETNQQYDLLPSPPPGQPQTHPLDGTMKREYRDETYVYGQVVSLAAQLKALGDGREMPAPASFPPIGLDPSAGGECA